MEDAADVVIEPKKVVEVEFTEFCTAELDNSAEAIENAIKINPANSRGLDPQIDSRSIDRGDAAPRQRAVARADKFWPIGSILKVEFVNGSAQDRRRVLTIVSLWSDHANVQFEEIEAGGGVIPDIRIDFNGTSNGSRIGTDSRLNTERGDPSMWFTGTSPGERTVLHEFAHALGLKHEHQNPAIDIQWDKDVVYDELERTRGWNKARVDRNVLDKVTLGHPVNSRFDPNSIMGYTIPSHWTKDGFSLSPGLVPSAFDLSSIGDWYPFGGAVRPARNRSSRDLRVFARGRSGRMFEKRYSDNVWSPNTNWERSGDHQLTGHPAVTPYSDPGRLSVVARSENGEPSSFEFAQNGWGSWHGMGGRITGSPSLVRSDDAYWCFVRGESGRPFFKRRRTGDWDRSSAGWQHLGGAITGSVAATVSGKQVAIAARAAETGQLSLKWWDGSRWRPDDTKWEGLGESITAVPALAWLNDKLHVVVRLTGGQIRHAIFNTTNGVVEQNWQTIDGSFIGTPTLVNDTDDTLYLVVRGISRRTFVRAYQQGNWSGWDNLGGQAVDSPTAIVQPGSSGENSSLHVFVTGLSRGGFHKYRHGVKWYPNQTDWFELGGRLD